VSGKGITYWSYHYKPSSFAYKAQMQRIADFNKDHPETPATVTNTAYSNDDLATVVAAGTPPNVAVIDRYTVAGSAARGLMQDVASLAARAAVSGNDQQPWAWQEVSFKGKLYGLPEGTDSRALYVNVGHLKQAGLPSTPPATLEEFADIGQKLTVKQGDGFKQIGFIPWRDCWGMFGWGWLFGGDFYDPNSNRSTLEDPKVVAALDWIGTQTKQLGYAAGQAFLTAHQSTNTNPFMQQVVSTYFGASNFTPVLTLEGIVPAEPGLDWTVWAPPPPQGASHTSSWSGGFCNVMPSGAKDPDDSFALMRYVTDQTFQRIQMQASLELPTFKALAQDPFWKTVDSRYNQFLNILPYSHSRPPIPQINILNKALNDARDAVVMGKQTASEALKQQNQIVNSAIQDNRVALAGWEDDDVVMSFDDAWAF